jgi:thiosulfate reductase cytochrome b subunit
VADLNAIASSTAVAGPSRVLIARHSAATRITHWLNALCLAFLLLSGLQIFNAHPHLYWGHYGADNDPAFISVGTSIDGETLRGVSRIGPWSFATTGVLGASLEDGEIARRAFPTWLTIPSYRDLATGRRWHFFFAWLFVLNLALYLGISVVSGHLRRDLLPSPGQVRPRHLLQEIVDHARLRFPKGEEARRYNALQKLAYLGVVLVLLPLMILTGLTMSPAMDAAWPWLVDLFGGRQSARTIHFIAAFALVAFVAVHIAMVLLSGLWNNLRSMVTGRYAITREGPPSP